MMNQEAERELREELELSDTEDGQSEKKFDFGKNVYYVKILHDIYDFFGKNKNDEFILLHYLQQLGDKEYTKEEVYAVLNNMADIGDIYFKYPDGRTCDVRINPEGDPVIQQDILFCLGEKPYGILLDITDVVYTEIRELSTYKDKIDWIFQQIGIQENTLKKINENAETIKQAASDIDDKKKHIDGVARSVEEVTKKASADLKKELDITVENLENKYKDEIPKLTAESVNDELKRDGKIGSFLQDIQRDFIQYMAIFIAVFALVNVNLNGLEGRTIKDFLGINLFLVASMTTLGALLDIVLCRPQNECGFPKKSMLLWCGSIVLWAISIIALICI